MSCRPQFQYSVGCLVFWIWTDWLINQVCVKPFVWVTSWWMSYFHRTLLHDSCSKLINKIRYHHLTVLFTGCLSKHIKIIKLWTLHLCPFCFCLIFMCTLHQDGSTVANSRTQISFYLFFKLGVTHTDDGDVGLNVLRSQGWHIRDKTADHNTCAQRINKRCKQGLKLNECTGCVVIVFWAKF